MTVLLDCAQRTMSWPEACVVIAAALAIGSFMTVMAWRGLK